MNESSGERDDSASDDEYYDEDINSEPVKCLFCCEHFDSIESAISHCRDSHKFDFRLFGLKFKMDCYSFIKFINFLRLQNVTCEDVLKTEFPEWDHDKFLKPVLEDDPWLMFDFEEYLSSCETGTDDIPDLCSEDKLEILQKHIREMNEQRIDLQNQLNQMKTFVHKLLKDDDSDEEKNSESKNMEYVNSTNNGYFESYSHPGIHYDMLSDRVRTESYRDAILKNETIIKGKKVLDLGCGTGILSMFAVSAGADKILAVDNSDIAYYTMDIVIENKMENKIQVMKSEIEKLPGEHVDIIISEWMGYFLLYEGMLDSLIYARDKFLNCGGILMPDTCNLLICGACDPEGRNSSIDFWTNVYGYRMSSIMKETRQQAVVDVIPQDKIFTNCYLLSSFNLYTCTIADTEFSSSFELTASKDTTITTLVGYFDTLFNLPNKVTFSTSPTTEATHWKQTLFHLYKPVAVAKGEVLCGTMTCKRNVANKRALIVTIEINDDKYIYNID